MYRTIMQDMLRWIPAEDAMTFKIVLMRRVSTAVAAPEYNADHRILN